MLSEFRGSEGNKIPQDIETEAPPNDVWLEMATLSSAEDGKKVAPSKKVKNLPRQDGVQTNAAAGLDEAITHGRTSHTAKKVPSHAQALSTPNATPKIPSEGSIALVNQPRSGTDGLPSRTRLELKKSHFLSRKWRRMANVLFERAQEMDEENTALRNSQAQLREEIAALRQANQEMQENLTATDTYAQDLERLRAENGLLRKMVQSAEDRISNASPDTSTPPPKSRKIGKNNGGLEKESKRLRQQTIEAVKLLQKYKDEIIVLREQTSRDARAGPVCSGKEDANARRTQQMVIRDLRSDLRDCRASWYASQEISNARINDLERVNGLLANSITLQAEKTGLAEARARMFAEQHATMLKDFQKCPDMSSKVMKLANAHVKISRKTARDVCRRLRKLEENSEAEVRDLKSALDCEVDGRISLQEKLTNTEEELFETSNAIVSLEVEMEMLTRELEKLKDEPRIKRHGRNGKVCRLRFIPWMYLRMIRKY